MQQNERKRDPAHIRPPLNLICAGGDIHCKPSNKATQTSSSIKASTAGPMMNYRIASAYSGLHVRGLAIEVPCTSSNTGGIPMQRFSWFCRAFARVLMAPVVAVSPGVMARSAQAAIYFPADAASLVQTIRAANLNTEPDTNVTSGAGTTAAIVRSARETGSGRCRQR